LTIRSRLIRRSYLYFTLGCFLICFSANTKAIEFVVDATADAIDSNPGDGLCQTRGGSCSLRAAIQETNALSGADIITLPAGLFLLTSGSTDEDNALSGDLDIRDDVVVRGAGADLTRISGANLSGVFSILSNNENPSPSVSIEQLSMTEGLENEQGGVIYTEGELSLSSVLVEDGGIKNAAVYALETNLNIQDSVFERNNVSVSVLRGQLNISNSQFNNGQFTSGAPVLINNSDARVENTVFQNNQGSGGSGAISAINSKAVITNNTFNGNSSASTGSGAVFLDRGIYSLSGNDFTSNSSARSGGAISSNAAMYIENNTFKANVSGRFGGAIEVSGTNRVIVTDSFFDANNAAEDCGALFIQRPNTSELLSVENSVFRNNVAGDVGGAICFDNNVEISHSEFSANVSRSSGGAAFSFGSGSSIVNSTISGNLAVAGSAIYHKTTDNVSLKLRNVTIADNESTAGNTASIVGETGALMLTATIVNGKGIDTACSGNIISGGYNLASDNSCALGGQGDLSAANASLGDLQPYGSALGSTQIVPQAHVPALGNPVLNNVPFDQCLLFDQAYKNRSSVQCDIGAVQLNGTDVQLGVVKFTEPQYEVTELETTATVKVSRVDGDFGAIGVYLYDTELGTASADVDYEIVSGRYLEWSDGDTSEKTINMVLYDDNSQEGTETIELGLVGATGGVAIGGVSNTATVSIFDDETSRSVFAFNAASATIAEDKREIVVTIVRTEDSVGAATVNVSTANGSAIAGQDYTEVNFAVNFPAGATSQLVTIPVVDDVEAESNETFLVSISSPTNGAALGVLTEMEITIVNDSGTTVIAGDNPTRGEPNGLNDQPGTVKPGSEPAPGTVITVGSARGGGGSSSMLLAFMLLFNLGWRKYSGDN